MSRLNFTFAPAAAAPARPRVPPMLLFWGGLTLLTATVWTVSTAITGSSLTALTGIGRCLHVTIF